MKHLNLKGLMLAGMVLGSLAGNAQVYTPLAFPATAGTNNYYKDYVGVRFTTNNPQLDLPYTIANDGSGGAGEWGGAITGTFTGNLVKAIDSLACSGLSNGAAINGNIALVYRGDCEFGMKALQCQNSGAIACVIVNNVPGGPVGMGAGAVGAQVTIPVLMISKEDGDQINAILNQSQTSVATIQPWANATPDEIAIIAQGSALPPFYAIPWHQLGNTNGNPAAYKTQYGAYLANFGTNPQTNVKIHGKTEWFPTTGPSAVQHQDSFQSSTPFDPSDSIRVYYADNNFDLHTTGTGRFDITTTVSSDADGIATNNSQTHSMYVTDRVWCKSRYDFANFRPRANVWYGSTAANTILWGPMMYSAKGGGYKFDELQWSISTTAGGPMIHTQFFFLLKWADGTNGGPADDLVDNVEVTLAGVATKVFNGTTADSAGKFFTSPMDESQGPVMLEDNTWYWTVAELQQSMFLGCDGTLSYLPRSVIYNKNTGGNYYEQYAPIYHTGDYTTFSGSTDGAFPFPFEGSVVIDSLRFAHQKQGLIPSIAMITSQFPVSTKNIETKTIGALNLYPNPATDKVNVSVSLNNPADKVTYTVFSVMGQVISKTEKANVQNDQFAINTSGFAPGNYYVIVTVGEKSVFEKFTVINK
jgi:hypothetical protein